jgi:hypothetical protein
MLFNDQFLSMLSINPISGAMEVIETVESQFSAYHEGWASQDLDNLLEAYALISGMIDARLLNIALPNIDLVANLDQNCSAIWEFLRGVKDFCRTLDAQARLQSLRLHFKTALSSEFHYEFSQGDLSKIQRFINELRELITDNQDLESDHQERLLRRLEKLQSELHKKVSDLDRFWGLIGDAGVVLGKLGNDAKPIVDRVKEIAEIVWQTQARTEELPSGTNMPLLGNKTHPSSK